MSVNSGSAIGVPAAGAAECGGMPCHGVMVVDFGYSYALSGPPSPTEIHFPGLMLHELTHILGYGSFIKPTGPLAGTGLNGTIPDVYTRFDLFVTELDGTPVIDVGSYEPSTTDPNKFAELLTFGVKFDGGFASVAAMGDFILALSDPTHSSLPGDIMGGALAFGAETFGWSPVDIGVLLDLGYAVGLHDADFDSDSDIDGADFLKWQIGLGTGAPAGDALLSDGDANHDGFVSPTDRFIWEGQYGTPGAMPPVVFPLPLAVQSVPEPTSLILLAFGTIAIVQVGNATHAAKRRGT